MTHNCRFRVYYEDTDSGGVVYHANYLKFAERGRTELLRNMGYENKSLRDGQGVLFVARRVNTEFLAPARLDDMLDVETAVTKTGRSTVEMTQTVFCDGRSLCVLSVLLVCVDAVKFKLARIPAALQTAFEEQSNHD